MNIAPVRIYNKNNLVSYSRINNQNFTSTYKPKKTNDESQMANLEFKRQKLKYSDEDLKKMESMTLSEKIDYVLYLKKHGLYTVVYDEDKSPAIEEDNSGMNEPLLDNGGEDA